MGSFFSAASGVISAFNLFRIRQLKTQGQRESLWQTSLCPSTRTLSPDCCLRVALWPLLACALLIQQFDSHMLRCQLHTFPRIVRAPRVYKGPVSTRFCSHYILSSTYHDALLCRPNSGITTGRGHYGPLPSLPDSAGAIGVSHLLVPAADRQRSKRKV